MNYNNLEISELKKIAIKLKIKNLSKKNKEELINLINEYENNNKLVDVYIEIEKHSNIKYEYDKKLEKCVVDRILDYPYFYPYAYGFIPNTLAEDNDELDVLIITNKKLYRNRKYKAYIIGTLVMEDEKGLDEKVLCVLKQDYNNINNISDLDKDIKDDIKWFFSNYKSKSKDKWSKVSEFIDKKKSIELFNKYSL